MILLLLLAVTVPDLPAGRLVLVGAGDIASCSSDGDEQTALLVETVLAKSENAWAFTLGDNVYPNGTREQFLKCFEPTWGRFKSRTLPAVGNHDYRTKNAEGFRATYARRFSQDGPLWYSVDVKGNGGDGQPVTWHVVVLDSNCDEVSCAKDGPQATWLASDLKKNQQTACTVALFHHPRFSSGPHGDATAMADLWALLRDGGVDLALSGHDHTYERFDVLDGMPSIVVGTGGKDLYPIAMAHKGSLVHDTGRNGVLLLALDAKGWKSSFLAADGTIRDEATGTCR